MSTGWRTEHPYKRFKNYGCLEASYPQFCNVCKVLITSQAVARQHFSGKRHLQNDWSSGDCELENEIRSRKAARLITNRTEEEPLTCTHPVDNILKSVLTKRNQSEFNTDLSIYRTPSGRYYCKVCNVTVNSGIQFQEHTASRKHRSHVGVQRS